MDSRKNFPCKAHSKFSFKVSDGDLILRQRNNTLNKFYLLFERLKINKDLESSVFTFTAWLLDP